MTVFSIHRDNDARYELATGFGISAANADVPVTPPTGDVLPTGDIITSGDDDDDDDSAAAGGDDDAPSGDGDDSSRRSVY